MTTEVAIMNRSAVALAADSAVTIGTDQGVKVYDSVNKLFELVKGRPVGVMIYNAADVALRPWETVIKTYREERQGANFGTVEEYAADFIDFMCRHDRLFSEKQQDDAFLIAAANDSQLIRRRINTQVNSFFSGRRRATEPQIRRTVKAQIELFKADTDEWEPGPWSDRLPSERALMTEYRAILDGVVEAVFQNLPMSAATRGAIRTALLRSFVRYNKHDDNFSGLVFAGFGQDEYYPSLRELRVKGMLHDTLMSVRGESQDIGLTQPAYVDSFAQGDMVRSFTVGIQDKVRGRMIEYWRSYLRTTSAQGRQAALAAVPTLEKKEVREIGELFSELSRQGVDRFLDYMTAFEDDIKEDLLASLAHLPKDEMGAMAESLVNLTTLKRRVSINDAQTVGGAVDVAVVSRGDGFVWLKRKHYFDQALNPNWAAMHAGATLVPRGGESGEHEAR